MIIVKHNSLSHNKISTNNLKYQEPENICDLQKSDHQKTEKHHFTISCLISHAKCEGLKKKKDSNNKKHLEIRNVKYFKL